uniref:Uncharacterized protein n=1 Tax=Amorphochlora amoebiformis TaxID=1561963 RepID=A0A0H5BR11_9EUKA|nr:hypothetical protein [Amorphochlora amoebiformis]
MVQRIFLIPSPCELHLNYFIYTYSKSVCYKMDYCNIFLFKKLPEKRDVVIGEITEVKKFGYYIKLLQYKKTFGLFYNDDHKKTGFKKFEKFTANNKINLFLVLDVKKINNFIDLSYIKNERKRIEFIYYNCLKNNKISTIIESVITKYSLDRHHFFLFFIKRLKININNTLEFIYNLITRFNKIYKSVRKYKLLKMSELKLLKIVESKVTEHLTMPKSYSKLEIKLLYCSYGYLSFFNRVILKYLTPLSVFLRFFMHLDNNSNMILKYYNTLISKLKKHYYVTISRIKYIYRINDLYFI